MELAGCMADKSYRAWQPNQVFLLPPSIHDWLPEGHLVYFLLDVVQSLDLSKIEAVYQKKDPRGERPWNPQMMVALLLYGYCIGVRSSRRLEKATYEDVAFRVLTGGTHPDHSSIAEFRKTHLEAISALFLEILRLCEKAGIVKLGRVALDGTKMKANASKHKAMSHARMKEREAELRAEIEAMLKEAGVVDASEDAIHGRDQRGDELPEALRRRQGRLRRIEEAKEALEAEAKAAREAELAERAAAKEDPPDAQPPPALPEHQVRHDAAGEPHASAQRNFTDPDSRIMKQGKDFVQGYNAQAVVDDAEQVIVAAAVTNQPADAAPPAAGCCGGGKPGRTSGAGPGGRRLLLSGEQCLLRGTRHRRAAVRSSREACAGRIASRGAWSGLPRRDESATAHRHRQGRLLPSEMHRRTCFWADQGCEGHPELPAPRARTGPR